MGGNSCEDIESNSMKTKLELKHDTKYPNLAKRESDGIYCYLVQRRISCHITRTCVQSGLSANTATLIDLFLAVAGALFIYLGFHIIGALFIQLFGIWSCVDGEIARVTKSTSKQGDFYDTMVDRIAEFLFMGALLLSVQKASPDLTWGNWFFAYMGAVFLITNSSEKYRSAFQKNYPKKFVESLFCWICAGSDIRFFYVSIALLIYAVSGSADIFKWLIIILTCALYINYLYRLWRIRILIK